jgi:hypothetical protein
MWDPCRLCNGLVEQSILARWCHMMRRHPGMAIAQLFKASRAIGEFAGERVKWRK